MDAAKILVVDDEENIAFLVRTALSLAGYSVETALTGRAALAASETFSPDAIVLDVRLPDLDGFEVLRRLRERGSDTPVLFLTARGATEDRVRGLTAGGDDYIVKPFALEELVARVQVALRRVRPGRAHPELRVADLVLDEASHRVWRSDAEAQLSATEFKLLRYLMANAGRVLTRAQILDHVWEYDFGGESSIIESFVSSLRKKVDAAPPHLIHTVRGVGYSIREP